MSNPRTIADTLERALPRLAPAARQSFLGLLAQLRQGQISLAEAQRQIAAEPAFAPVRDQLAPTDRATPLLDFESAQTGDIRVEGGVAGRDIVHNTFIVGVSPAPRPEGPSARLAARRREALESRIATLMREYDALQLRAAHDSSAIARAAAIWEEMERAETELTRLERVAGEQGRALRDWQVDLPKIDFRDAKAHYHAAMDRLGSGAGAGLFLIQNSSAMCGEWYVAWMHHQLSDQARNFRHFEIGFLYYDTIDPTGLLQRLARHLGIEELTLDRDAFTALVVDRLCALLQGASIVLLDVRLPSGLASEDGFLPWLVEEFWQAVIAALPTVSQRAPLARLLMLLSIGAPFPCEQLPHLIIRSPKHFSADRILELPLQPWEERDIAEWLLKFSGLDQTQQLDAVRIMQASQRIYQVSRNGEPLLVYNALRTMLGEQDA